LALIRQNSLADHEINISSKEVVGSWIVREKAVGDSGDDHMTRSGLFERLCASARRCSRRQNVIDQQNSMVTDQRVGRAFKNFPDVGKPLRPFQFRLRTGWFDAHEKVLSAGTMKFCGKNLCQQLRLVESSLPHSDRMKGNRNDHLRRIDSKPFFDRFTQKFPEKWSNHQPLLIFQGDDKLLGDSLIGTCADRLIEKIPLPATFEASMDTSTQSEKRSPAHDAPGGFGKRDLILAGGTEKPITFLNLRRSACATGGWKKKREGSFKESWKCHGLHSTKTRQA